MEVLRCRCGFLHLVFIAACLVQVQASGKFTILLVDFSNPTHTVYNGDCCDNLKFCSWNECDNFFRFCAALLGSQVQCSLGGLLSTKKLGDDDFRFPGKGQDLGGGLTNPITYSFHEWKGASVVVEVWDDDRDHIIGKLDDFVDKYTLVVTEKPAKNKQSSTSVNKKLCGKRSCTNVEIEVYCDDKYLIPECTEYCVSRDSDAAGHYTCDYDVGRKVCREGWYDADSNCTKKKKECTPRNDTAGHYDCNPESGEKLCLAGWMGKNCTKVYVPTSTRLPLATSTLDEHTQTEHAQQSTTKVPPSATYTADRTVNTAGSSTTSVSQHPVKTSSVNGAYNSLHIQPTSTVNAQVHASSPTTHSANMDSSSTITETLHSLVGITTVLNKETTFYQIVDSSTTSKGETRNYQTTSVLTLDILQKSTEIIARSTIDTMTTATKESLVVTSASSTVTTSSAHVSSIGPTLTRPTTDWDQTVVISVSPRENWTREKEDKLKSIIKEKLDAFCKKRPQSCNIDPNITINSTSIFNTTDVLLDVRNESTGDGLSVTVRVKLPNTIPGLSGGVLVPSIAVKQVITESKDIIKNQTGLTVSLHLEHSTNVTMTTTPTEPLTTDPPVVKKSTPSDSVIPGLDDYWTFVIGVALATLLLLVVTLCFTFHVNRPNKVHPLKVLPRNRASGLPNKEDPETISLTTVQLLPPNKTVVKIQTNDTALRSRTSSSTNLDNVVLFSPFTPDYSNTYDLKGGLKLNLF